MIPMPEKTIILASQSETRRIRMDSLKIPYKVIPSNLDESKINSHSPQILATTLAFEKANSVAKNNPNSIVIGADAFFILKGKIFGKPKNKAEAKQMLSLFSGNSLRIHTGLCVIDTEKKLKHTSYASARIKFRQLTEKEIASHLEKIDPTKYAGGFHESTLINFASHIHGEHSAIGGFPMHQLIPALREFGIAI